jgi:hypothetical protein
MADTHVQETAPTLAANLVKVGDSWLQPSTKLVRVCVQVQPTVVFSGPGGGASAVVPTVADCGATYTVAEQGSINAVFNVLRQKGIIA